MTYKIHKSIPSLEEFAKHALRVWDHYEKMILSDQIGQHDGDLDQFDVVLNEYLLAAAIEHARVALSRWADYHLATRKTSRPNNHKLAGFLAKWIAKVRPVQVIPKQVGAASAVPQMPAVLYSVNASFAGAIVRSYLGCDVVDSTLLRDLVYKLHYRDETSLNLSFMADVMEKSGWSHEDEKAEYILPKWSDQQPQ